MRSGRGLAAAAALACVAAAAGCGIGGGERQSGEASLIVTRDYGAEDILETTIEDPAETDTVIRALDREAEITTRHGGGFVQSIEGIAGAVEDGRSHDWFFYVNGIESPVGAAEVAIEPGDRIWWDHHDWTEVMRVPAVVGSFPQPFASSSGEGDPPIEVGCAASPPVCESARAALDDHGVEAETIDLAAAEPGALPRLLVGEFHALASDRVASLIGEGPERSGVFARVAPGDAEVELLDAQARPRQRGAFGLIAATASGEEAPTWVVTGTSPELVAESVRALGGALLHNRFALALDEDGETIALPVAP